MTIDLDALSLNETIQLQTRLSETLKRRFERFLALAFTDIANSTNYFATFGNEAGRALQLRHLDVVEKIVQKFDGRIVDVAGDGAFTCFTGVDNAVNAMANLQQQIEIQNSTLDRDHQLGVRAGIHWGAVLTDGNVVTGKDVNLCARIAATAAPSEIRLTLPAFQELPNAQRLRCIYLPPESAKGFTEPVPLVRFQWREISSGAPGRVRIQETGEEIRLPDQDAITFGRLREYGGQPANDIVLSLPEPQHTLSISRWHIELRRRADGWILRSLTDKSVEVDGRPVTRGDEICVHSGSITRLSNVITLEFLGEASGSTEPVNLDATLMPRPP